MADLSRRKFITRGSLAAATAGLLASAPAATLPSLLSGLETGGAAAEGEAVDLGGALEGPVVAHIRDLATGEISIFSGTQETIIRDPGIAARLARAAR